MKIAIIECGYIGSAVAELWTHKGHQITATTQKKEHLPFLSHVAQKGIIFKNPDKEQFIPLIMDHEALLITLSTDPSTAFQDIYLQTAKSLYAAAQQANTPRLLIYTSTTSVYGDHQGLWVDEESHLHSHGEMEKYLIECEKLYLSLRELGWHVCILRFAEIYGPDREISTRMKHLQGTPLPGSGDRYTNMIHKEDCVRMIDYALDHRLEGIFNGADDDHPSSKELYDRLASLLALSPVTWDPSLYPSFQRGNKRVSNHKIKRAGYPFMHPSRLFI